MMKFSMLGGLLGICLLSLNGQNTPQVTTTDYQRAESMLSYRTDPLVDRAEVQPQWVNDNTFWYEVLIADGKEYVLVDPLKGQVNRAASKGELGIVEADEKLDKSKEVASPDGKYIAFLKDWNLWIRETATGAEHQLTFDGVENYGYATDNAGWRQSDRPVLVWSPDGRKIATYQQDQRHVSDMYLVETQVGAPKLKAWKYPLPEDPQIVQLHRVIIDLDSKELIRLKSGPDPHRSSLCDDIYCDGKWTDVQWSTDSKRLAFLTTSRDHKETALRVADAQNGEVREIYQEITPTQFESGANKANWRYLPETNEFIWYTEREGWGHLYLYDLGTGKMKNRITQGEWAIWDVLKVDKKKRRIYFTAGGKEAGRDPYFAHFYGVNFDGSELKLLTPENGQHQISISPARGIFRGPLFSTDCTSCNPFAGYGGGSNCRTGTSRYLSPESLGVEASDSHNSEV